MTENTRPATVSVRIRNVAIRRTQTFPCDNGIAERGFRGGSHTVTADVTMQDGRAGMPYDPPAATPDTDRNPVGRFMLNADVSGSSLDTVTVTQDGPVPSGVESIELWRSSDQTFDPGGRPPLRMRSCQRDPPRSRWNWPPSRPPEWAAGRPPTGCASGGRPFPKPRMPVSGFSGGRAPGLPRGQRLASSKARPTAGPGRARAPTHLPTSALLSKPAVP